MKFFSVSKDGGPESNVTAFWLCEIKGLFSIALLKFTNGSRESFHSHAFNSVSWLLKGHLREYHLGFRTDGGGVDYHSPSVKPIVTKRNTFHQVFSSGTSWVLTFRGPWAKDWQEYKPSTHQYTTLVNGRRVTKTWTSRPCNNCGCAVPPPPPV